MGFKMLRNWEGGREREIGREGRREVGREGRREGGRKRHYCAREGGRREDTKK